MTELTTPQYGIYGTIFIRQRRLSKLDQQNIQLKIEEWEKSQPESNFHFQPFIKVEQCEESSRQMIQGRISTISAMDPSYSGRRKYYESMATQ